MVQSVTAGCTWKLPGCCCGPGRIVAAAQGCDWSAAGQSRLIRPRRPNLAVCQLCAMMDAAVAARCTGPAALLPGRRDHTDKAPLPGCTVAATSTGCAALSTRGAGMLTPLHADIEAELSVLSRAPATSSMAAAGSRALPDTCAACLSASWPTEGSERSWWLVPGRRAAWPSRDLPLRATHGNALSRHKGCRAQLSAR